MALKVLKPAFAYDEVFEANFRREAHRAAKIRHPNVIAIHYAGKDEDIVFFSMDLLQTGLKDLLNSGQPLAGDVIAKVGIDVASALQFAHTHEGGIVHRDLKPDNILFDRHGNAVVTDFGISEAATNYTAATGTTVYVGTPKYMSPEQARGQRVDGRSDIYSLGVTLFEMATGEPPFSGRDWFELGRKHIVESPPAPRDSNPELPPELENVILKCLQKNPEERYQSALELREELVQLNGGAPRTVLVTVAPSAAKPGAAQAEPQRAPGIHELTTQAPRRGRRLWRGALALTLIGAALGAYADDLGGLRGLAEAELPAAARLPVLGSGNLYLTGLDFAAVGGGADVDEPDLQLFFNDAVDPATANGEHVTLLEPNSRVVPAEITPRDFGRRLVLRPTERLRYDTNYRIRIGPGLRSRSGRPAMQDPRAAGFGVVLRFRTRLPPPDSEPPRLVASEPRAGARNVPVDAPLSLSFSEELDPATVDRESVRLYDARGEPVDAAVSLSADLQTASVKPLRPLRKQAAHMLRVTSAVTDRAGNALASDSVAFSTGSTALTVAAPARVSISVRPARVMRLIRLVLDGRTIGTLPIEGLEIEPDQRHSVELVGTHANSSYSVSLHRRTIMLRPGEQFEVSPRIKPFGAITVTSEPYADVFIDGKHVGATPLAGYVLLAGPHKLELHPTAESASRYAVRQLEFVVPPFDEVHLGRVELPPR